MIFRSGVASLPSAQAWRRSRDTTRTIKSRVRARSGRPRSRRAKLARRCLCSSRPGILLPPSPTSALTYTRALAHLRAGATHGTRAFVRHGGEIRCKRESRLPRYGPSAGVTTRKMTHLPLGSSVEHGYGQAARLVGQPSARCLSLRVKVVRLAARSCRLSSSHIFHIINLHIFLLGFSDRKSTRLNSSHSGESRMPSSA